MWPCRSKHHAAPLPFGGDFQEQEAIALNPLRGDVHHAAIDLFIDGDVHPLLGRELIRRPRRKGDWACERAPGWPQAPAASTPGRRPWIPTPARETVQWPIRPRQCRKARTPAVFVSWLFPRLKPLIPQDTDDPQSYAIPGCMARVPRRSTRSGERIFRKGPRARKTFSRPAILPRCHRRTAIAGTARPGREAFISARLPGPFQPRKIAKIAQPSILRTCPLLPNDRT